MADPFQSLSEAIADRVAAVAPHLLSVRSPRRRATAVAWSDELAITAAHVLFRREDVNVVDADGRERAAAILARDPATDLALLRIEGGGLAPIRWEATDGLRVGELVLAVGRPGAVVRASLGMLSAVGPAWRTRHGVALDRRLDVDGALPRGFSGGLLVGARGPVGLNTHDLVPGGTTIPSETLRRVVDQLATEGSPGRGYLGVSSIPAPVPPELVGAVGVDSGVLIVGLEPGGPAAVAGLLQGDLVVSLDGRPIPSVRALVAALRGLDDRAVPVRIVRAGALREVQVALGRRV